MKKIVLASVIATALVLGTSATAFASTAAPVKPIAKPTAKAGEGTATHEMSESSSAQKHEGMSTTMAKAKSAKKHPVKKAEVKK